MESVVSNFDAIVDGFLINGNDADFWDINSGIESVMRDIYKIVRELVVMKNLANERYLPGFRAGHGVFFVENVDPREKHTRATLKKMLKCLLRIKRDVGD